MTPRLPKGEGGAYVAGGVIALGGRRPNNTSGGHLAEGYTHGMSMVIETVRLLRGTADDYCPGAAEGCHTYDYRPGGCRQVRDARIAMNMGWAPDLVLPQFRLTGEPPERPLWRLPA